MRWECGECGGIIERHRPRTVCPECGTAGVPFVRADELGSMPELGQNMRDAWLYAGLERRAPVLHPNR